MKNKLDKRIDEALAESPCDQNLAEALGGEEKPPMGVSQWREYGKKYGYWEFFEKEAQRRERDRIDQKVRTDISTALATAERNMDSFDPKHPRCPKCGKLMAEMEPHIWMCACSPDLRLSIG